MIRKKSKFAYILMLIGFILFLTSFISILNKHLKIHENDETINNKLKLGLQQKQKEEIIEYKKQQKYLKLNLNQLKKYDAAVVEYKSNLTFFEKKW